MMSVQRVGTVSALAHALFHSDGLNLAPATSLAPVVEDRDRSLREKTLQSVPIGHEGYEKVVPGGIFQAQPSSGTVARVGKDL